MPAMDGTPAASPARTHPRQQPDWRGWIALAWAVAWGSAYAVVAFHARAAQVMEWIRHMTGTLPGR